MALYKQTLIKGITAAGTVPDSHRIPLHRGGIGHLIAIGSVADVTLGSVTYYFSEAGVTLGSVTYYFSKAGVTLGSVTYCFSEAGVTLGSVTYCFSEAGVTLGSVTYYFEGAKVRIKNENANFLRKYLLLTAILFVLSGRDIRAVKKSEPFGLAV